MGTPKIGNVYLDKDEKIEFRLIDISARETGEPLMILSGEKGSSFIIREVEYSTFINLYQEIE